MRKLKRGYELADGAIGWYAAFTATMDEDGNCDGQDVPYPFDGPVIAHPVDWKHENATDLEHEAWTASLQLHRKFAAMGDTPNDVLRFANQFGLLGRCIVVARGPRIGEFVNEWLAERDRLRLALELLDDPVPYGRPEVGDEMERLAPLWRHRPFRGEHGSQVGRILQIFGAYADGRINGADLYRNILKAVVLTEVNLGASVTTEMEPGSLLKLQPKDLLGAIWVHFLNEIVGAIRMPVKCAECGKYYVPSDRRSLYCGNACKIRAYRRRNREKQNGN